MVDGGLRRAQIATLVTAGAGSLVLLAPSTARFLLAPDARVALEVSGLCAVLFAAVTLALPADTDVRPARNAFVAGLVVLALSNAVFAVWPILLETRPPLDRGLAYYPWLAARYVSGLLFISAGLERPRLRLPSYLIVAVALLVVTDLVLVALPGDLLPPVEIIGSGVRIISPWTNFFLQAIPAVMFGLGSWLAGRLYRRSGAPAYLWLSVSLIVQVFAQLHEIVAPAILGPVVATADAYRLLAVLLLLGGALHQLGFLYRSRSIAVHRQQRDLWAREQLVEELRGFAEQEHHFRTLVSHELSTPLATIRAFTHVLQSELGERRSPRLQRALDGIDSEARRLLELGERMDELRDLEIGSFSCELRPVLLRPMLDDAAGFVRGLPGVRPVTLVGTDVRVMADPLRLGQALRGVLVNAVRYSPAGTPITIEAVAGRARVEIRICDAGPGIPASERAHVQQRYARGSAAHATPGHGLGLYLAARIAEAHGGTLSVAGGDPAGTQVSFELEVV